MRALKKALAAVLLFAIPSSDAAFIDGNLLYESMEADKRGFFYGCVVAVAESFYDVNAYCPPQMVTRDQAVDLVQNYLIRHPEKRHLRATLLVVTALKEAWPCA
jgi:hypothetical protein